MEGARLIHRLLLRNFLSYGPAGVEIELQPLNVLIGPNASGKSNLIEALGVLRATPRDLAAYVRERGGAGAYVHGGPAKFGNVTRARIDAWVEYRQSMDKTPLRHSIEFTQIFERLDIFQEEIRGVIRGVSTSKRDVQAVYEFDRHNAGISIMSATDGSRVWGFIPREELKSDQSVLSLLRDPRTYPEITHLANSYDRISLFQEWTLGRNNRVRSPQATDLPTDFPLPDASNLALVLHDLMQQSVTRSTLLEYLKRFYDSAEFISTKILGGTAQLFIEESGGQLIPASRLSDGTLRYLSLLAILLHPSPPPLVCIEEPELGLHPDMIHTVAELLRDASQRMQLVVTTHSDALVSALSDVPESIVVCEPGPEGTVLRRLDRERLSEWLEHYTLGEIWQRGEIGGNRW